MKDEAGNLHYITFDELALSMDSQVDGVHATDLGMYNPQNEMFRLLGTKRSFSQNETFFFSHP